MAEIPESKVDINGQLSLDNPSVGTGLGPINAEQYEVQIRDNNRQPASRQLSPHQLAELKEKADKIEISKYFALKVGEANIDLLHVSVEKMPFYLSPYTVLKY